MRLSRRPRDRRPASSAPAEQVLLRFGDGASEEETPQEDLSAVAVADDALWLAGDESASLERLVRDADGSYGARRRFPLADLVDLPDDDEAEVDIEGIDVADGWLWVVGSHACARRKADPSDGDVPAQLERLAAVRSGGNRQLLARIPLVRGEDGHPTPVRTAGGTAGGTADGADGEATRHAARLRGGRRRSALTRALRDDEHLAPSLGMPSKENGFDVEGLAVVGPRLLLGLRGPVLRGIAVVLEVEPRARKRRPERLGLARIGPGGRRYRKHFLDLCGLGVRDLCVDGDDVLVLAGPTMTLDGRCVVFRWPGAAAAVRDGVARAARGDDAPRDDTLVGEDALEVALDLPYGAGTEEGLEHPEGIAFVPDRAGRRGLLVVHDSPSAQRRRGPHEIAADLYRLD